MAHFAIISATGVHFHSLGEAIRAVREHVPLVVVDKLLAIASRANAARHDFKGLVLPPDVHSNPASPEDAFGSAVQLSELILGRDPWA